MIITPDSIAIGGTGGVGIWTPDSVQVGRPDITPADTIFIQNDSDNSNPASPWYVTRLDATHYTMLHAVAPKNWQYLGAFLVDGKTGARGARANGAVWTVSDTNIVRLIQISAAGQAAVSILKAGTVTLTVTLNGMVSTLVITAV